MATLSSISTKIPPLLPCNLDSLNEQKTQWRLQEGVVDASSAPFPVLVFAPLPCRSSVQSKQGIARRSNGKRRETFETIVGSCISRAVAFSNRQFRAILKSFSDSSAKKISSSGHVRCHTAGKTYSDGPIDNGNGDGGGGGSESGSPGGGESGGGNPPLMGPVWRRGQKCTTRGRSVLIRAANRRQIYDHATSSSSGWLWVGRVAEATMARALMEPAVADAMLEAMLIPFGAALLFLSPEFGNCIRRGVQLMLVGPFIAVVLLWLLWRWWRKKNAQGLDSDGEGDKQEDEDTQ